MQSLLLLPLISGFLYAFSSFLTKRALQEGVGILRFSFLSNFAMLITFSLPMLWRDRGVDWDFWIWPLLSGVLFFAGQVLTFAAIRVGDVSLQTPLMGTKVLFVAVFTILFGVQELGPQIWLASVITVVAIMLLGFTGSIAAGKAGITIGLALGSAAAFALADVCLGRGAPAFGPAPFLALMMLINCACSLFLIPFFRDGIRHIPRCAWSWTAAGVVGMAVQSSILGFFFANTARIAEGNILYSSRGIWSVLLGIVLAAAFSLSNESMGTRVLLQRLAGALLMSAAIWLVLH